MKVPAEEVIGGAKGISQKLLIQMATGDLIEARYKGHDPVVFLPNY